MLCPRMQAMFEGACTALLLMLVRVRDAAVIASVRVQLATAAPALQPCHNSSCMQALVRQHGARVVMLCLGPAQDSRSSSSHCSSGNSSGGQPWCWSSRRQDSKSRWRPGFVRRQQRQRRGRCSSVSQRQWGCYRGQQQRGGERAGRV
jgi:hypothetical protein